MSDPDRLAEIKGHRDLLYGPNTDPLHFVDIRLLDLDWLLSEVDRLRDLVARLEWAGGIETGPGSGCVPCCPMCEVEQGDPHGHDPGCDLAAVLHPDPEQAP